MVLEIMVDQILIITLGFILGIVGNLLAGWIQNDVWKNIFNPSRIVITFVVALIIILLAAIYSGSTSMSYGSGFLQFPVALTHPISLIAYLATLGILLVVAMREKRLRIIIQNFDKIPEKDRKSLLETEIGIKLPTRMSPEDWLKARKQSYDFVITLVSIVTIVVAAVAIFGKPNTSASVLERNAVVDVPDGLPYQDDANTGNLIAIDTTYFIGNVGEDPYYLAVIVNIRNGSSEGISVYSTDLEVNGKTSRNNLATFSDTFVDAGRTQNIVFLLFNVDQDDDFMRELEITRSDFDEYRRTYPLPSLAEETMPGFRFPSMVSFSVIVHHSRGKIRDTKDLDGIGVLPIWVMDWIKE